MSISSRVSLLLAAVVATIPSIACAQNATKPATKDTVTKVEKHSIKAFRCTLANPYEAQQTVHTLLGDISGGLGFGGLGIAGFNGFGGGQKPPTMGSGFAGGGLGNLGGGQGFLSHAPANQYWRTMVDPRTETLLVRGTDKDLEIATEFINVVETPAEKPTPEVKNLHVYRLKHADPKSFTTIFNDEPLHRFGLVGNDLVAFEQQIRVAAYKPMKMLVAVGGADALKKMDDVVKTLDVASSKQTQLTTKVFRLQLCDLEDAKEALERLLQRDEQVGLCGGLGTVEDTLRISLDARTRSVIVRSTVADVQIASELFAIIETPTGKPLPKTEKLTALELKHADADELVNLVAPLELNVRALPLPFAKLIILQGEGDAVKSYATTAKELDIPEKEELPKEPKRLFRSGANQ